MSLTAEQKQAVATWVAAGDNLSTVQRKLADQFQVAMTYRDVRFLVDDLNLDLKDAAPKVDTSDITKASAPKPAEPAPEPMDEDLDGLPPEGEGSVTVSVDKVTLIPGAIASGTVTFSDGVTGKWMVDQYGRPGFTEVSQQGYSPKPDDAQAFMQELNLALQQRGF